MFNKFKLYIISLMLLMVLVILSSFSVPIYFGRSWTFCGWAKILTLNNCVAFCAFLMVILALIFIWQFNRNLKKCYDNLPVRLTSAEILDQEYLSFFFTLISCLVVDFSDWNGVLSFIFILIIFGVLFVKTDWFYANPCFAMLGYHIYKVKTNKPIAVEDGSIIISKDEFKGDEFINRISISKNVLYTSKIVKNDK